MDVTFWFPQYLTKIAEETRILVFLRKEGKGSQSQIFIMRKEKEIIRNMNI